MVINAKETLENSRERLREKARGKQRQGFVACMRRRIGQSWSGSDIIQHSKAETLKGQFERQDLRIDRTGGCNFLMSPDVLAQPVRYA